MCQTLDTAFSQLPSAFSTLPGRKSKGIPPKGHHPIRRDCGFVAHHETLSSWIRLHLYIYMCVCVFIYLLLFMYTYIYIYIHINIYIYIYLCVCKLMGALQISITRGYHLTLKKGLPLWPPTKSEAKLSLPENGGMEHPWTPAIAAGSLQPISGRSFWTRIKTMSNSYPPQSSVSTYCMSQKFATATLSSSQLLDESFWSMYETIPFSAASWITSSKSFTTWMKAPMEATHNWHTHPLMTRCSDFCATCLSLWPTHLDQSKCHHGGTEARNAACQLWPLDKASGNTPPACPARRFEHSCHWSGWVRCKVLQVEKGTSSSSSQGWERWESTRHLKPPTFTHAPANFRAPR